MVIWQTTKVGGRQRLPIFLSKELSAVMQSYAHCFAGMRSYLQDVVLLAYMSRLRSHEDLPAEDSDARLSSAFAGSWEAWCSVNPFCGLGDALDTFLQGIYLNVAQDL